MAKFFKHLNLHILQYSMFWEANRNSYEFTDWKPVEISIPIKLDFSQNWFDLEKPKTQTNPLGWAF